VIAMPVEARCRSSRHLCVVRVTGTEVTGANWAPAFVGLEEQQLELSLSLAAYGHYYSASLL
jgi:hypothetical protein